MKRKRKLRRIVPALFIALVFLAIFLIVKLNFFTVKSIEVQIKKTDCTDKDKIKDVAGLLGQNIFFINQSRIETELKRKFFCIKSVEISKIFPNKIELEVLGREPAIIVAVLQDKEATQSAILEEFSDASSSAQFSFVVDNEGIVYSTNIEQINAPNIYVSGFSVTLGQKIKEKLIANILKILEKVKHFGIEIKEVKMYSQKNLLINGTLRIIFRIDDGIDEQIASLQLILEEARIYSNSLEFIDLRFDKPIVRFAPKKK